MGLMRVPVAALVQGQVFEDWFPLIDTVMKPLKHGAAIRATISFRYCPGTVFWFCDVSETIASSKVLSQPALGAMAVWISTS